MQQPARTDAGSLPRQFSLKWLLTAVTAVCVALALLAFPPFLVLIGFCLYVALTGSLAVAIWQGRGWVQAFAIGAIVPHVAGYFLALAGSQPSQFIVMLALATGVSAAAGVGAASWHGILVRRRGLLPVPDVPILRDLFSNGEQE